MRDLVYIPKNREVLAKQWDGTDAAYDTIGILCQLCGRTCSWNPGDVLNITVPTEQRSDMHVQKNQWVVFGQPGGVNVVTAAEFTEKYQKVK